MTATYDAIATTTVSGTSTSSVTFSSISASFTDLVLISIGGANSTAFDAWIRFNSDTGSNYSLTALSGTGSAASSSRESNATFIRIDKQAAWRSGNRTMNIVHIMNYSNTTTNKTILSRANAPADATDAIVGLWRNTSAINSITVSNDATAAFADGTTFTLYGIKAE
jgi:hypothetical protein